MNKFIVAHEIITSHRTDGVLLWAPDEKHLFFKKKTHKSGLEDWICYQEMIQKKKSNSVGKAFDQTKCTSRLLRDPIAKTCTRKQIAHTDHEDHDLIYKDLMSMDEIKDTVDRIRDVTEGLSVNVPMSHVFTRTLAK